ncbi:MAG TPA: hypothetical protein VFA00_10570 [Actinomycetota bacterium]|nr:hypothetical protein [Actinomycetota bacterium]
MKPALRIKVRFGHGVAGGIALSLALAFLGASVAAEVLGSDDTVARVKHAILFVIPLLAFSAIVAGGSGTWMSRKSKAKIISRKAKRMRIIGANAVLVLIPCAVILDRLASGGEFGARFDALQAVEFVFGATNVALLGLNMRDGLRMRARRGRAAGARRVHRRPARIGQ